MAGMRTVEELLELAPDRYDITVFGAEPHANYNRILLSPVLAGEMTIQDIMLNDVGWYEKNDIRLHLRRKVVRIERGPPNPPPPPAPPPSHSRPPPPPPPNPL